MDSTKGNKAISGIPLKIKIQSQNQNDEYMETEECMDEIRSSQGATKKLNKRSADQSDEKEKIKPNKRQQTEANSNEMCDLSNVTSSEINQSDSTQSAEQVKEITGGNTSNCPTNGLPTANKKEEPYSDQDANKNETSKYKEFGKEDNGPFIMFLQRVDNKPERINALLVNRFLINKFDNSEVFDECKPIAKNKVRIKVFSKKVANEILKLPEWKNQGMEIFIPNHLMERQGVIKVPTDLTEEEIMKNLEANHPIFGPVKVTKVRRFFTRKVNRETKQREKIPTLSVQITFKGQELPHRVALYKVTQKVELYYPQVRQCYRCLNFGHLKYNCKSSQELCHSCGSAHPIDECNRKDMHPICKNCKGNHVATDRRCEVWQKQQDIRNLATERNISLAEAKKLRWEQKKNEYNSVEFPTLSQEVGELPYSQPTPASVNAHVSYAKASKQQQSKATSRPRLGQYHQPRGNETQTVANAANLRLQKQREAEKLNVQKLRQQHQELLLSPNGHLPPFKSLSLTQLNSKTDSSLKAPNIDNNEVETNIQIVKEVLLQKMTLEDALYALQVLSLQDHSATQHQNRLGVSLLPSTEDNPHLKVAMAELLVS
ncbi:hypothetical protein QAD02_015646 [Eretmocerus hayati]|uniref:Uncharacterized protein n=1 Tax=Eretmocerus hayati TaxID=131215 RepID=A0ACC2P990_9HYME|nr:hypothetical protein QAD02_015646 [Eretmocerus hayati]